MFTFFRSLPALSALCAGYLLALGLFYLCFVDQAQFRFDTLNQQYGQSLAKNAANQAIEPSFRNDLVSLRGIVQEIANNPHVLAATVHDVENKLLAQAGELPRNAWETKQVYTAPVTLHESIAAYITVVVEPQNLFASLQFTFISITALLALITLAWSIYRSDALQSIGLNEKISALLASKPSEEEDSEHEPVSEEIEESANYAYAAVCVKNIAVLQQQLNGETFRRIFSAIEELIEDIMVLYNGTEWSWQEDRYILRFRCVEDEHGALFQAACSAYLMLDLASIVNNIPLDLSAQIDEDVEEIRTRRMPFVGLAVQCDAAQYPELMERAVYIEMGAEDDRMIISEFKSPYASLLQKQATQLSS